MSRARELGCAVCEFGVASPVQVGAVECRKFPPRVFATQHGLLASFPQLVGSAWCGYWQERTEPAPVIGETAIKTAEKPAGGSNGKA